MMVWIPVILLGAVSFLALELASRWWIRRYSGYYVWEPGMRLELRQVPELFPEVEPRVRFEINADGERGSDVRADEAGLFRILVAGGSPVECFALDQPTSWPAMLERLLNTATSRPLLGAQRVHVGSIGRGGIASQQLDLIFERVLPRYRRLKTIVIMVGGNDVFHWLEDGAPTSLEQSVASPHETFVCHPEQRFGWRPARLAAVEVMRRLRRTLLRPVDVRERAGSWVPVARKMRAEAKEWRTSAPDPTAMLDRFEHHFRRLLERATAHADRVLVLRQPWFEKEYTEQEAGCCWHGGTGKAWKQKITSYYTLDVVNQLMGLVDARAANVADDLGIEQVDLRRNLAPTLENYYDYVHYTPTGAGVVARTIAAVLLRPPLKVRLPQVSKTGGQGASWLSASGSTSSRRHVSHER